MKEPLSAYNISRVLRVSGIPKEQIVALLVVRRNMSQDDARKTVDDIDRELVINGIYCYSQEGCSGVCRTNLEQGLPVTCIWPQ